MAVSEAGLTRAIARYAATSRFERLPADVRREAERAFLNWIGVAIGGCREPASLCAARYVAAKGRAAQAKVIGHGQCSDAGSAALVNCISSSVLAYDDAHLPSVAHPSGPVAAALFALAQARGAIGTEFLNALALGIELQCRLANMLVLPPAPMDKNFYVNGFSGPIGVAAAASRLIGLHEQATVWAIGLAASQASGFRATHGTMTAHFRPGHAAEVGIVSALLAEQGFDCTEDALEARGGFLDVYARGSDPAMALADLGARHEMLENRYKPYPCGIVIHPVIDACLEVRRGIADPRRIRTVTLHVNPLVIDLTGKRRPTTPLESHVSVFHWAAAVLATGQSGLRVTETDCYDDPAIQALSDRIDAVAEESMDKGQARVEATLVDGTVIRAEVTEARGSKNRPMTDGELEAKFLDLCSRLLRLDQAEALMAACWSVGRMADVDHEIGDMLP